jgi:hypothetical protein
MEVHRVGMLVYDLLNAHPAKIASWICACETPSQCVVGQGHQNNRRSLLNCGKAVEAYVYRCPEAAGLRKPGSH